MFPYIDLPYRIKYSYRNSFVMMPRSTMSSGHSSNISTGIYVCRNVITTSYSSDTHPYFCGTGLIQSRFALMCLLHPTQMTLCIQRIDFVHIDLSVSSSICISHFTGTGFLPLYLTLLLLILIQAFLDIKFVDFRHWWHFPQISNWYGHFFLESFELSCVSRNWNISQRLDLILFVF